MKNNILIYPAIFRKEEKGGYSVFIPDLNNSTCGENLQEAIYMAKDLKIENKSDFVSLIDLNYDEYKKSLVKSIKKTVYISKVLNDKAESLHINFSQTLQDALTKVVSEKNN